MLAEAEITERKPYETYRSGADANRKTIWDYLLPEADKRLRKKVLKSTSLTSYQSAVKDLLSL